MTTESIIENYYPRYMILNLFVDSSDEELINKYTSAVNTHNSKLQNNPECIDAGFDLFCPDDIQILNSNVKLVKIDYNVVCSAQIVEGSKTYNTGYYMYPRSSISKSSLRLANNVGIIDTGYRGHLIGMFDVIKDNDNIDINKLDRQLQICAPSLMPIVVRMVTTKEQLGEKTVRGEGGFGSTGR